MWVVRGGGKKERGLEDIRATHLVASLAFNHIVQAGASSCRDPRRCGRGWVRGYKLDLVRAGSSLMSMQSNGGGDNSRGVTRGVALDEIVNWMGWMKG